MVRTLAPSAVIASIVHDLIALPLTWTTQAPHCDVSQPTCVPVSRRFSRRNCTSRVRGSTSPVTALPFTVSATAAMAFLLEVVFGTGRPAADQNCVDFASGREL